MSIIEKLNFTSLNQETTLSLFPSTVFGNIFSWLDAPHHGLLATVCKTFNEIVNSGIEKGRNAREYLLGKLNIERIDLTIGVEDVIYLYQHAHKLAVEEESPDDHEKFKVFQRKLIDILRQDLKAKGPAFFNEYVSIAKSQMIPFASASTELDNRRLGLYLVDQNSPGSIAFIKPLALASLIAYYDEKKLNPFPITPELEIAGEELYDSIFGTDQAPQILEIPHGSLTLQDIAFLKGAFGLVPPQVTELIERDQMAFTANQNGIVDAINILVHCNANGILIDYDQLYNQLQLL